MSPWQVYQNLVSIMPKSWHDPYDVKDFCFKHLVPMVLGLGRMGVKQSFRPQEALHSCSETQRDEPRQRHP